MSAPRNIFITGRPGIGKTTAIRRTLERLPATANGFTTSEIRHGSRRVGFLIESLDGESAVMAHVDFDSPVQVGKYGVDLDAVERVGVGALRRALRQNTPAIVDEVGKMELACSAFAPALLDVVRADLPVLGTMHARRDSVTEAIRARPDAVVLEITRANRDGLPDRLAEMIREAPGGDAARGATRDAP